MDSESLDIEAKMSVYQDIVETETLVCTNCDKEVPKMLFCPNCGYPLYIEKKGEKAGTEDEEPVEQKSQPDRVESVSDIEEKDETIISDEDDSSIEVSEHIEIEEETKEEVTEKPKKQGFFSRAISFMGMKDDVKASKSDVTKHETDESISTQQDLFMGEYQREESVDESTMDLDDGVFHEEYQEEILEEESMDSEESSELQEMEHHEVEVPEIEEPDDFEPDRKLSEVQKNLFKVLSLKMWLVDTLRKGEMYEEHFVKKYREYEAQLEDYMTLRQGFLSHLKDLEHLVKALRKAKVSLSELKMKKDLGIISENEYEVKAPFHEWDIKHYEEEISRRRASTAFLEDPSMVISADEFLKMKILAEDCLRSVEMGELTKISNKTLESLKTSLKQNVKFLEQFTQM
jgi:hypothetical protein